jgi:hypothetical protein
MKDTQLNEEELRDDQAPPITAVLGLALSTLGVTSPAAIPLGTTAAAIEADNALVELVARHGSARSGGQAHAVGTQRSGRTNVNKATSKSTNVAAGTPSWRAGAATS